MLAIAAAALLAGFTVQDAEKALDGQWAGMSFAIGLEINGQTKTATLTEAGKTTTGPFKVEAVSRQGCGDEQRPLRLAHPRWGTVAHAVARWSGQDADS